MKKHFIALFCALTLLVGALPPAAALEGETLRAADTLATLGLVQGNGTDYALEQPITRAQAAVLLVRLAGAVPLAEEYKGFAGFRDTPNWAYHTINYAAGQGWITGVTASEFRPDAPVTANAWCTMLLRMLGYSDKQGDFAVSDAAMFVRRIGLVTQSYEGTMTRGDVFETMAEALTFPYKDSDDTVINRLVARNACPRAAVNALGLLKQELTARQAADRHMAAVFCINLFDSQEATQSQEPTSNASGFFITADGLAVTNYHSIEGSVYAEATLSTGETFVVKEVVYYDTEIDIAVIRVSQTSTTGKKVSSFAHLELAGTDDIRAGDTVYTISNPLGLGLAISSGIISATAKDVERYALPCVMSTADISQGSSGGALLNVYGQVIAVTSGAFVYGNNMYLAVPVDPVMAADLTVSGKTLAEVAKLEATPED